VSLGILQRFKVLGVDGTEVGCVSQMLGFLRLRVSVGFAYICTNLHRTDAFLKQ